MILRIFDRKWILTTLLVLAAMGVMIRLGIWQLDRLAVRRAFNARVESQLTQPELFLDSQALNLDLHNMEYRAVRVVGQYQHNEQIALRNQAWQGQWGVHLVTPLLINGTNQAILIDRGWIPADVYQSADWSDYDESGQVEVIGILRRSQVKADFGSRSDPQPASTSEPIKTWNFVNVDAIQIQTSLPLLPAYVQQSPDPTWTGMPYRSQPEMEISEGPHMGYAIQWFTFASILGIGYPFFIRRQELRKSSNSLTSDHTSIITD